MSLLYKEITSTYHGKLLKSILTFYVPLVLKLPRLRDDPKLMATNIKSTSSGSITDVVTAADSFVQNETNTIFCQTTQIGSFGGKKVKTI